MPPSPCPLCRRLMCDHTHLERGQTYAQMMGDPPGFHSHRDDDGCLCDDCADPHANPRPRWAMSEDERRQDMAVEILASQEVAGIYPYVRESGEAMILTDAGSVLDIGLPDQKIPTLIEEGIAYMQADEDHVILTTTKRHKIRVTVRHLLYVEPVSDEEVPYLVAKI